MPSDHPTESPPLSSVAVVCGGTAGIGLATAARIARNRARVVVLGRHSDQVARAVEVLAEGGADRPVGHVADARRPELLAPAFDKVAEQFGYVNALVNAVGPSVVGTFDDLDDDDWTRAFDEGTMTAVRSIRCALPLLRRASWARIVNVTAMSVQHQTPALVAYTAAKSALASVTKNLARTLAPEGILVNAVAPGSVLTERISGAVRAVGGDPSDPVEAYRVMAEQFGAHIDLGRVARPEDVAEVVAFCASPDIGFLTGAHINVDGGSDFV